MRASKLLFLALLLAAVSCSPPPGEALPSFSFPALGEGQVAWEAERGVLRVGEETRRPKALFVHVFQPDCGQCRAQARALQELHRDRSSPGLAVVGLTHRGGEEEAREFVEALGIGYPVAVATGSEWARRWGSGDPMYVLDSRGGVAYQQVGYGPADPGRWRQVARSLLEGEPVAVRGPGRTRLRAGDPLPPIQLPSLTDPGGRVMALTAGPEGIVFRDAQGEEHAYRAAIGFFSRY